jgi:hypothetical protein
MNYISCMSKLPKAVRIIFATLGVILLVGILLIGGLFFYYYNSTCTWFFSGCTFDPAAAAKSREQSKSREILAKKYNNQDELISYDKQSKEKEEIKTFQISETAALANKIYQINSANLETELPEFSTITPKDTSSRYLVLDITFSNNSEDTVSVLGDAFIKNSEGVKFDRVSNLDSNMRFIPNAEISPGMQSRGVIAFKIPKADSSYKLYLKNSYISKQTFIFDLGNTTNLPFKNPKNPPEIDFNSAKISATKQTEINNNYSEARMQIVSVRQTKGVSKPNDYRINTQRDTLQITFKLKNTWNRSVSYSIQGEVVDSTGQRSNLDNTKMSDGSSYGSLEPNQEIEFTMTATVDPEMHNFLIQVEPIYNMPSFNFQVITH